MAIDRTYTTNRIFITITGDKSNTPVCHTNTSWDYVLPLVDDMDKAIYSMLLSAQASGAEVLVEGKGLCDVHSSIETMTYHCCPIVYK